MFFLKDPAVSWFGGNLIQPVFIWFSGHLGAAQQFEEQKNATEQQWSINVFGRALCATCNISSLFRSDFGLHRLLREIWSFSAAKCYAVFASCTAVLCWKPKPDAERSLSRGMCKVVIFEMYKKKTGKQNRKWLFTVHNIIQVSGGPRIPNWSEKMLFTPFLFKAEIFTVAAARSDVKASEAGTLAWGCK